MTPPGSPLWLWGSQWEWADGHPRKWTAQADPFYSYISAQDRVQAELVGMALEGVGRKVLGEVLVHLHALREDLHYGLEHGHRR